MVQVNRSTPAVQDKDVLSPAVALKCLGAGVIQASVDLNRELELAKDNVEVVRRISQDNRSVRAPSGDSGVPQQAVEQPFRLRPGLGTRIQQQLTLHSIAHARRCQLHCSMELRETCGTSSQRLIDAIATDGRAEIQCRQGG